VVLDIDISHTHLFPACTDEDGERLINEFKFAKEGKSLIKSPDDTKKAAGILCNMSINASEDKPPHKKKLLTLADLVIDPTLLTQAIVNNLKPHIDAVVKEELR
jgi:hypothetical protein